MPFSPSGLGVQEGVLALLFSGIGLSAEVALAASLLSRLALMVTTLAGGILLTRGRPVRVSPVSKPVRGNALPG